MNAGAVGKKKDKGDKLYWKSSGKQTQKMTICQKLLRVMIA